MLQQRYCKGGVPVLVMGMVCDKDAAAMFEAEVEHGATEHVTIIIIIILYYYYHHYYRFYYTYLLLLLLLLLFIFHLLIQIS